MLLLTSWLERGWNWFSNSWFVQWNYAPVLLGAIGAVIALFIALIQAKSDKDKDEEMIRQFTTLRNQSQTILDRATSVLDQTRDINRLQNTAIQGQVEQLTNLIDIANRQQRLRDQITSLTDENRRIQGELSIANQTIIDNIRGGLQFTYVEPNLVRQNLYELLLINPNQLPVFGFLLEITDAMAVLAGPHQQNGDRHVYDSAIYGNNSKNFTLANLEVGGMHICMASLDMCGLLQNSQGAYQIKMKSRSKTYYQLFAYTISQDFTIDYQSVVYEINQDDTIVHTHLATLPSTIQLYQRAFPYGVMKHLFPFNAIPR